MTAEQRAVSQWLDGLNRTEWALINIDKSIEELERKLNLQTIQSTVYDKIISSTRSVSFPTEEHALDYMEMEMHVMVGDRERLEFLKILRREYQLSLRDYDETISKMVKNESWGKMGSEIIHAKYRRKINPDQRIFAYVVFCAKPTFYRILGSSLSFFYDILPSRFR